MKSLSGRVLCISMLSLLALFHTRAEKQSISREQAEALVSKLKFQQGEIRSDDCGQRLLECVGAVACFPFVVVLVCFAAFSSRSSRCARPAMPHITKLLCRDRSSVGFGHTSGRRFGEDAQRFF